MFMKPGPQLRRSRSVAKDGNGPRCGYLESVMVYAYASKSALGSGWQRMDLYWQWCLCPQLRAMT
jgi:hypothetical protein